jgi:hypothetical protein
MSMFAAPSRIGRRAMLLKDSLAALKAKQQQRKLEGKGGA